MKAAERGDLTLLRMLLGRKKRPDLERQNLQGRTALQIAAFWGRLDLEILDSGAPAAAGCIGALLKAGARQQTVVEPFVPGPAAPAAASPRLEPGLAPHPEAEPESEAESEAEFEADGEVAPHAWEAAEAGAIVEATELACKGIHNKPEYADRREEVISLLTLGVDAWEAKRAAALEAARLAAELAAQDAQGKAAVGALASARTSADAEASARRRRAEAYLEAEKMRHQTAAREVERLRMEHLLVRRNHAAAVIQAAVKRRLRRKQSKELTLFETLAEVAALVSAIEAGGCSADAAGQAAAVRAAYRLATLCVQSPGVARVAAIKRGAQPALLVMRAAGRARGCEEAVEAATHALLVLCPATTEALLAEEWAASMAIQAAVRGRRARAEARRAAERRDARWVARIAVRDAQAAQAEARERGAAAGVIQRRHRSRKQREREAKRKLRRAEAVVRALGRTKLLARRQAVEHHRRLRDLDAHVVRIQSAHRGWSLRRALGAMSDDDIYDNSGHTRAAREWFQRFDRDRLAHRS